MTPELERLAREAGGSPPNDRRNFWEILPPDLARFAALVLEDAQKDAARYRWLRQTDGETFIALAKTDPDGLDRNIDAAMLAAPQSPEGLK